MKIRFCENNEGSGVVYKQLRAEFPQLDIKRKKCVKNCSACSSSPFARQEGNQVRGKTSEDLYQQLVALIKTNLLQMKAPEDGSSQLSSSGA